MLQAAATFALNAAFAWLVGACCARTWLRGAGDGAGDDAGDGAAAALRTSELLAAALGVFAGVLALLAATAVMAGVGLGVAPPMVPMMLSETDYGHAGSVAVLAMAGVFLARLPQRGVGVGAIAAGLCLAVFTLARASMGHAGEGGYWTLALAAEVFHLAAIAVWTGAVFVSAWLVLRNARVGALGARAVDRYLARMSHGALLAVAAIVVTGAYSAWQRVGSGDQLLHTAYGATLLVKLGLVGIALALGGYNKFIGLPAAHRSRGAVRRVRLVLRIESVVLTGVLMAAAVLTSQQPPTAM